MNNTVIFIYARSDSSRFPNKCMSNLSGHHLIELIARRCLKVVEKHNLYLLTTDRDIDDNLADFFFNNNFGEVIRGNAFDLVDRTSLALDISNASSFIRVNGDCPLVDFHLLDICIDYLKNGIQLVSNIWPYRSFPYGISVEGFSRDYFDKLKTFALPHELEHVTQHLYRLSSILPSNSIVHITNSLYDVSYKNISLAIDDVMDLKRIEKYVGDMDVLSISFRDLLYD